MRLTIFSLILLCAMVQGCKQKCTIDSKCYPSIFSNGYTSDELDTLVIRTFKAGGSFAEQVDTFIVAETKESWWIPVNGTGTTFSFSARSSPRSSYGLNLLNYITDATGKYYDFEIVIPSVSRTYKVSNLVLAGPVTCQVTCQGGSVSENESCGSGQYIASYTIDGVAVNNTAANGSSYVVINK